MYPKKVKKREAEKVWKSKKLDRMTEHIVADVEARLASDSRWKRGYIPDPPTYLRGERWNDELEQASSGNGRDLSMDEVFAAQERAIEEAEAWEREQAVNG